MRQPPLLRRAGRPSRVDPRLRPAELADLTIDLVEITRRSYEGFQRNDLDAIQELYHQDMVWDMTHWEGFPEQQVFRGHDGLREVLKLLHEDIGVLENRAIEIVDLDDGRAFVKGGMRIRGTGSGIELEVPPFGQVIEFRDGLNARVDNYSDLSEARRVAGLPEA